MRFSIGRKRPWLGIAVVATAALPAATGFSGSPSGTITTFAGNGKSAFSGEGGPATRAGIVPRGVAVDVKGNVYVADGTGRVRKVNLAGKITTIAGTGKGFGASGDGGPATAASLFMPERIAVDGKGNVYITSPWSVPATVRKVSVGGTITTMAGGGTAPAPGYGDGGPATAAWLVGGASGVAVDPKGNVYIGSSGRVRKVNPDGTIAAFAGTGSCSGIPRGDGGPATRATLCNPQGLAVDGKGNLYIADIDDHRVRKVSPGGTITTIAGTGKYGFSGDGGPAAKAMLNHPSGVAVDAKGNVYIVEGTPNNRVRKVSPGGKITTFAGTGWLTAPTFSGDGGPAIKARLSAPSGVAVDAKGNVYIADMGNRRVRKVRP
jgi:trimeric autotransporter adhesin